MAVYAATALLAVLPLAPEFQPLSHASCPLAPTEEMLGAPEDESPAARASRPA